MRNRELFTRRLEQIEGRLKGLTLMVSRGSSVDEFRNEITNIENIVDELKGHVEREPMSPEELNYIPR
jgi:DNA-binding FrmR family transcriptional regulator